MDNRSYSNPPDSLSVFSESAHLPLSRPFYLDPMVTVHLCPEAPVPPSYTNELPLLPFTGDTLIMDNYGDPYPFPFPMPYANYRRCDYAYGPPSSKRNERERQRVKCVNEGYARLRRHLPEDYLEKRLSKVETLRAAIKYISYLQSLLYRDETEAGRNPRTTSCGPLDPSLRVI
ncbi:achaete-scute homolog 3 [Arvicola amphibius]|uniref:achaete-scute homolog 3 n=1 Tax=Arvicola amphibius TaxID=1047088 RepID=UPI0018E3C5D5|nr:achaete-scute homolog 3 [Arvicola amphibius]